MFHIVPPLILFFFALGQSPYPTDSHSEIYAKNFESLKSTPRSAESVIEIVSETYQLTITQNNTEYIYVYIFRNRGQRLIKIIFLDQYTIVSPLIKINQEFYLSLRPRESLSIIFSTDTAPRIVWPLQVIAEQQGSEWNFSGADRIPLYLPEKEKCIFWQIKP